MSDPSTPSHNNTKPRRRSWIWISLIGVVIVAVVLVAVVRPNNAPTAAATTDLLNFADVVVTDLTQEEEFNGKLESIKGAGTLIPAAQIDLAFDTPGIVVDLPVQVGQEVQAGVVTPKNWTGTIVQVESVQRKGKHDVKATHIHTRVQGTSSAGRTLRNQGQG